MTTEVFEWRYAPSAEYAVIGSPIHHSLSPKMHTAAFAACDLNSSYVAIHVPIGEVADALDHLSSLGYKGVNVTVPHKEDAFRWATTTTQIASDLRVCNTLELPIKRGHNTDVPGVLNCLVSLKITRGRALVLGAGGSSRATVYALRQANLQVDLWNRTHERSVQLADSLGGEINVVETPSLKDIDIVVNTTSASLTGQTVALPWTEAPPELVVFDLAYASGLTPLLRDATDHGHRVLDGRRMLMEQGAVAFEIWWKQPAPRNAMLEAIS